jgi:hypothetical protein
MFVPYYGTTRAFIANYSSWREYARQGRIAEVASSLLSHESLHIAINRFSLRASAHLDNMFGRSDTWEVYRLGFGDLNAYADSIRKTKLVTKSAKKKRKNRSI